MQLGTEAALKASANLSAIALLSHSPSMTDRVVFLPNLDLMHVAVPLSRNRGKSPTSELPSTFSHCDTPDGSTKRARYAYIV